VKDPQERLGGGEDDAEELKRHPFFKVSFHPSHACYLLKICLNRVLDMVICAKKIERTVNVHTY
jgi:hypothetical protein